MKLHRDLREFIGLLKSNGVEFVVIGGWAVGFHATPRYTGDFDFFVKCTIENGERLKKALISFGFSNLKNFEASFIEGDRIIQFGIPPNRIDILTKISGVSFESVWRDSVIGELDGISLPLISRSHLIENKRASGRLKDLADAEVLEKTKPLKPI